MLKRFLSPINLNILKQETPFLFFSITEPTYKKSTIFNMNKSTLFPRVLLLFTKWSTLIFCLLLSSTVLAQDQYSFNWSNQPLSVVFADIEKAAKVSFAYNPAEINAKAAITLRINKADLEQVLTLVCDKVNARYKRSGNTIMIKVKML